jgi:hypothetical protein
MDIFDRIASEFQKEARIPKGDTKAYEEWKKNFKKKNPEAAEDWDKYEGAFDPSTGEMSQDRIKKNMGNDKEDISALGQLGKKASFYDDEIIDDIGLERVALWGYQTPAVRRDPIIKGNIAHRLMHLNRQKSKGMLTREEEMELMDLEEKQPKSHNHYFYQAMKNRRASFYDDEIIDDIGLERVASEDFFFQI